MFQTNNVKNINNFINIFDLLFHEEYVRANLCANSATINFTKKLQELFIFFS